MLRMSVEERDWRVTLMVIGVPGEVVLEGDWGGSVTVLGVIA